MVRGCALGGLILFVSLGAVAQEASPGARKVPKAVACNNDDETCRENCTIEFGSSFRTRAKLGTCMETCRTRHQRCTEQWTELHRNNLDPENETKPAATVTREVVEEVPEPPPPELEAPVEEAARPYNEGITIPSDEQLAGPTQPGEKPAKRKEEPAPEKKVEAPKPRPAPPSPEKKAEEKAEEKKDDYDISEWDPDGE